MSYSIHDSKYHKPTSSAWRFSRLNRSRRLPLIVVCCVLVLVVWHHTRTIGTPHDGHEAFQPSRKERGHVAALRQQGEGEDFTAQKPAFQEPDEIPRDARRDIRPSREELLTPDHGANALLAQPAVPAAAHNEEDESEASIEKRRQSKDSTEQQLLEKHDSLPKGPVNVKPDLDHRTEKQPLLSSPDVPAKVKVIESEPDEHLSLEEKGDHLPDVVYVPFETAVQDVELEGWEDDWIAHASFDSQRWKLQESKIDFVYLWVNGSEDAFQTTKRPYEENSVLNDEDGEWINSHGVNRYRDWDELRYSVRSIEKYASSFRNKIQIIVNSVKGTKAGKQVPTWLKDDSATSKTVEILSQEEFFDTTKHVCLPTFNSLTIENQLFNTPSDTDFVYALSDDMLLGKNHTASDIHSPLFGPVMGFKTNSYNTINPPTDADAQRFGEKPFLIYTSWLLNKRFGNRKRKGQGHFGHALSRSVMREAIGSFPGPELQSACKRFRGEPGFQLYSWYAAFHYLIERHREAMIWSYIMLRSDQNGDGYLSWHERQAIMKSLESGMKHEGQSSYRKRNFYHTVQLTERAGLPGPKVNTDILWTSLDGPSTIMGLECEEFDVNECLAPGFSISSESSDATSRNPMFSTALVFDRLARQMPNCGDCMLKLLLNQVKSGLSPVLPNKETQSLQREVVVKALMRYRYTISNPDALFVMVTDAEQVDATLTSRYIRGKKSLAGQLCLNDDVSTTVEQELQDVKLAMTELYQGLFPEKSQFEI